MLKVEVRGCGANKGNDGWEGISFYEVGGWLALSCREWCILLRDSLIASLCLAHAAFLFLCGQPFVIRAGSQQRCHCWVEGVQGALGRGVPSSAVFSCLKYSKIKNWMSWILDKDELGSCSSLKLVPSCFACPVNGKKTELPLNSLDKIHWQLWLHIFKVLWLHIAVLQCSLDYTSVLYCCGWSQTLIYPDPMQTEVW